jgi:hypothetical protein
LFQFKIAYGRNDSNRMDYVIVLNISPKGEKTTLKFFFMKHWLVFSTNFSSISERKKPDMDSTIASSSYGIKQSIHS